jgi:hypothetical protein
MTTNNSNWSKAVNFDYPKNDLMILNAVTPTQCKTKCETTDNCVGVVTNTDNDCYLKYDFGAPVKSQNTESFQYFRPSTKWSQPIFKNYSGNDIISYGPISVNDCKTKCENTPRCSAISTSDGSQHNGTNCWLKYQLQNGVDTSNDVPYYLTFNYNNTPKYVWSEGYTGINYQDNQMTNFKDLTVEQCQTKCENTVGCAGIVMGNGNGTNCWLRGYMGGTPVKDNRYTSYKYNLAVEQETYKGNPLVIFGNQGTYDLNQSIKSHITDPTELNQLASVYDNMLSKVGSYDPTTITGIQNGVNSVLQEIPIKTGCCMRNQNDDTARFVKIRVPPKTDADKTFGFSYDSVIIPANVCPTNLYKGSPDCDGFYDIYCKNIEAVYAEQYGTDSTQFGNYAPECGCYAPDDPSMPSLPAGIPPACYKDGCSLSNPNIYPDPVSRGQACDLTICSSILNVTGNSAAQININSKIVNECGANSVTKSSNPNPTPNPTTPATTTPTTPNPSNPSNPAPTTPNPTNPAPATPNPSNPNPATPNPSNPNPSNPNPTTPNPSNPSNPNPTPEAETSISNSQYTGYLAIILFVIVSLCCITFLYYMLKKKKK